MPLIETPFSCQRDDFTIRGCDIRKEDAPALPIPVIICHGFGGNMLTNLPYGRFLAELGYRAFVFDFCGGGFSTASDGSFADDMTPLTEVSDLKAVIAYVRKQDNVQKDNILLMGCSQSGFVAALTASEEADANYIAGLILFYPAFCIPDDVRHGRLHRIRFDPDNIGGHVGQSPLRVSGAYPRSVMNMDIYREILPYKGPVFLIHGTSDEMVPFAYARKAAEVYRANGNRICFVKLENAPHVFKDGFFDEACAALKDWLS